MFFIFSGWFLSFAVKLLKLAPILEICPQKITIGCVWYKKNIIRDWYHCHINCLYCQTLLALFALQYTLLTMLTLLSLLSLLTLLYEQKVGWMDGWIPLRLLEHLFSKKKYHLVGMTTQVLIFTARRSVGPPHISQGLMQCWCRRASSSAILQSYSSK